MKKWTKRLGGTLLIILAALVLLGTAACSSDKITSINDPNDPALQCPSTSVATQVDDTHWNVTITRWVTTKIYDEWDRYVRTDNVCKNCRIKVEAGSESHAISVAWRNCKLIFQGY